MKSQEARSTSSCAACKYLKRRCSPNCQFAPYFRSDEPKKFVKVHKVFGASNVSKILNEVAEEQREETVNSLVYEAEVRLRDPIYGCIGAIVSLQRRMTELQHDLILARARLACCYVHDHQQPAAAGSFLDQNSDHVTLHMPPFLDDDPAGSTYGAGVMNSDHNSLPFDQFGHFPFPY